MRHQLFILAITMISFSCGSAGENEKDSVTVDTASSTPPDSTAQKVDTPTLSTADSSKTVTLSFNGYEEGDYAHLLFMEVGTGIEYDFGHPDENVLNNIDVVVKTNNSAFGYKENSKMKDAKFIAVLIYKMADTYNENGQPVKAKQWRISNLKKIE